jgi:hypothetical protein
MIIIKLKGGLGNQMFQYAFGKVMSLKNSTQLYLDTSGYANAVKMDGFTPRTYELTIFDSVAEIIDPVKLNKQLYPRKIEKYIRYILGRNTIKYHSPGVGYDNTAYNIPNNVYYVGYFQSYKYYTNMEDRIKECFKFKQELLNARTVKTKNELTDKHTISVHIRRGDYVTDSTTNENHGLCSMEYYNTCIDLMMQRVDNPVFVFFSDDIEWVKNEFGNRNLNSVFIDFNTGSDSWMDLYLMQHCKHNIIANSSFSWWGAWLNHNSSKIVCAPNNWFKKKEIDIIDDLIPESWLRIDNA